MSFETPTPNMSLPVPGVGLTAGPVYATDLNNCLSILDSHDHSAGRGVQITPAGLNISADLTFNNNNATNLRSVRLQSQGAPLALASDLGCLYEVNADLFFNDGNGTAIRLTQSGGIAGAPGSISGLVSPASATYIPISSTFVWQSGANLAANLDAASILLRNLTVNSKALTLQPPSAMAANYSLTLPTLPSVQSFMTLDAFGNMSAPWTVDNSSIKVTANQLVAQAAPLVDGVSLKAVSNVISIRNSYMQHEFVLNGAYGTLPMPQLTLDLPKFFDFNATILSVWIYNGVAGSAGITEFDVKVGSSGGAFTSILSTTGKIDSTAASSVWTDSNTAVGVQTGVTKPVVTTTNINAGQALPEIGRSLSQAQNIRLVADYNGDPVSAADAEQLMAWASEFVATIRKTFDLQASSR